MDLKGEQIIKAPRDIVFAALNDPEILKESIPGCQTLTKLSDTEMEAEVGLKIGPVKTTFKGAVQLSNIKTPESYMITGEGKGGAAEQGEIEVEPVDQEGVVVLVVLIEDRADGEVVEEVPVVELLEDTCPLRSCRQFLVVVDEAQISAAIG